MKICSSCGTEKSLSDFHRNKDSPDGLRSTCKACHGVRTRAWAVENRGRMLQLQQDWREANAERIAAYMRERDQGRRGLLDAIKRERGCVDCGTSDGELHFDHRPGEQKLFNIADGMLRSDVAIAAEIAKCDVRCASCHSKRHRALERLAAE